MFRSILEFGFEHFFHGGFTAQLITVHGIGDLKDGIDAYRAINQVISRNSD
jgi:hypothetical protein